MVIDGTFRNCHFMHTQTTPIKYLQCHQIVDNIEIHLINFLFIGISLSYDFVHFQEVNKSKSMCVFILPIRIMKASIN